VVERPLLAPRPAVVRPRQVDIDRAKAPVLPPPRGRSTVTRLALAFGELATLLDAGLTLQRAVATQVGTPDGRLWQEVLACVHSGASFSEAMAFLPPADRALLRVGEETGDLAGAVRRVAACMEQQLHMRRRVTSMMIYPLCVFVLCLLGVLAAPVLFDAVYRLLNTLHVDVPWTTRVMMAFSHFIQNGWTWTVVSVLLLGAGPVWKRLNRDTAFRYRKDNWILRFRFLGDVWRHHLVVVMTLNLATLYEAGVPLQKALRLAGEATGNMILEDVATRVSHATMDGETLSVAMKKEPLLPALLWQLVATGEETGTVGPSLRHFVRMGQDQVDAMVFRTLALLEPALYWVIGSVAAFTAVASLSPLVSAMDGLVR
jgi:type II secretory pathway component PulF